MPKIQHSQPKLAALATGKKVLRDLIAAAPAGSAGKQLTDFQIDVLSACSCVPRGFVATYGALAKHIAKPLAARGVGQALARNPFAPTVPCHRVVGSDGNLTGFQGVAGVSAKKVSLLQAEDVVVSKDGVVPKSMIIN